MASFPRISSGTIVLFAVLGSVGLAFLLPSQASAHGSMESPVSRVLNCRLENPENPHSEACKAAVNAGGTQPLYDWNGVRRGDANDQHRAIIPDGQLCSGGDPTFQGLDLPRADWPTTPITPDSNGDAQFVFHATAPHATQYMEFYVTKDGYDPTKRLAWLDLESQPFCTITNPVLENGRYYLHCPLPHGKTGKHLIYHIWQRADSPEAFYTCIDVEFLNNGHGDPSAPRELGQIRAQQDLPVGSVVTFRLFEIESSSGEFHDVDSHKVTVGEGMGTANQWPYHLAQKTNSDSQLVKIGVLQPDGSIEPVMDAQGNHVYALVDLPLDFEIDIRFPEPPGASPPVAVITANQKEFSGPGTITVSGHQSSDPNGLSLDFQWAVISGNAQISDPGAVETQVTFPDISQDQVVTLGLTVSNGELEDQATLVIHHKTNSEGNVDFIYPEGRGQYQPGTVVLGSDGNRYECRPFPNSGWCNIESDLYYAPGTGLAWQEAWIRLDN
ncbi:MAG: lytic polysaccharide monooxygenase [Nitrospirales bacterium]|nr:lytic polysaccharide monooxygenase [Nitrospirales bacterium]